MLKNDIRCLRDALAKQPQNELIDCAQRASFASLLSARLAVHGAGQNVLLAANSQFDSVMALVALDGAARQIVLCPPDLPDERRSIIAARTATDVIVTDAKLEPAGLVSPDSCVTDWILLTSGTSGVPKTVRHTFASLVAAIKPTNAPADSVVWATFYDTRRMGGLQVLLRAFLGGHTLVLSNAQETMAAFLARAGACGVTHMTGTPSHWRSALMSPAIGLVAPRYIRLSGEIADQAVLDALKLAFPAATLVHAYASTEAGVVFDVTDGQQGFPANFVDDLQDGYELRVVNGELHVRSVRTATAYVGDGEAALLDSEGYYHTGDIVERRGDRYFFAGRRGGIINVGGAKVHPEEVEAVINRQPGVRVAQVKAKTNPIVGSIVVADVVASDPSAIASLDSLRETILAACRAELAEYKVPVIVRFVADLPLSSNGKLKRPNG